MMKLVYLLEIRGSFDARADDGQHASPAAFEYLLIAIFESTSLVLPLCLNLACTHMLGRGVWYPLEPSG